MTEILKKYKYNLNVTNNKIIRYITQILTGHNNLNHSRANRKRNRQPFCTYCKNIRETSEHYLGKMSRLPKHKNTKTLYLQCFGKDHNINKRNC